MELDTIICGDNAAVMATWPEACINLVVTSPPYDNAREYGGHGWDFDAVRREITRTLKPGGVCVWVVADKTTDGTESGSSFRQALAFKDGGLNIHDTMIYAKETIPLNSRRYQQAFDFMFVFSKGKPNTFNPIMMPCRGGGGGNKIAQRDVFGVFKRRSHQRRNNAERMSDNVWFYTVNGVNGCTRDAFAYDHPAVFHEQMAADHILSWSNPGDVVLDPFAGSGTTLKMAKEHGRRWIGIEVNPAYVEICWKRVAQGVLPLVPNAVRIGNFVLGF